YMSNDLDTVSEGETTSLGAFANIAYEFNSKSRIRPFVGAGIGFAQVNYDDGVVDDDDIGFAYQAKAGVAYDINERLTAEVAYRYMNVTDVEFQSGAASVVSGDYDNQAVTIGLRYKLGS
ncbi:MAG: outer membrane protein, partial [Brevundimonas sp.]